MIDEDKAEAALALIEDIAYSLVSSDDEDVIIADIGEERSFAPVARFDRGGQVGPTSSVTVLRLSVAPSEIAQVIGQKGRTAHSLRVLLNAVGVRHGQRYLLEIVEQQPEGIAAVPRADEENFNR